MANFLWVIPFVAAGVAGVIVYVAVTQGLPAAWAMVSGWWNKGKADIQTLKDDVAKAKDEINTIKAKVGL